MNAAALVSERVSRRVTPGCFLLAIVCFFFTFAGVSCNTGAAKQAVQGLAGLGGGAASRQLNGVDACLDALNNTNLVSYSGITLVFGGAPSELSSVPASCTQLSSSANGAQGFAASQAAIGAQPLALTSFVAVVAGLLLALAALLLPLRARLRLGVTIALGAVAFVTLLVAQAQVRTAIVNTLNNAAAGAGAPFSITGFFTVDDGAAWIAALVLVALVTLYAGACLMARAGEPHPVPLAPESAAVQPSAPDLPAG